MGKNLTTRTTIERLAAELKTKFSALESAAGSAFRSLNVSGNTVSFYTTADHSGEAAATFDFPAEYFLDQSKTALVASFQWTEAAYPGSTNPNLEGKPVFVLAVKGDGNGVTYSFADMNLLVDTYKAKTEGKDGSTTITIAGYEVEVAVNRSSVDGNLLEKKPDGLYVGHDTAKTDKVAGATEGNIAGLDANGNLTDSGISGESVVKDSDINDYTVEEIAALLANTPA